MEFTRNRSAYREYDYLIDGMVIQGDNPIYTAIVMAGGPDLEITHDNLNAYRELGQVFGSEWKPFEYRGRMISRVLLPKAKARREKKALKSA